MTDEQYQGLGNGLGVLTAIATFIGCWIYCSAHYGFLLGFGLGWLPSGLAAVMAGFAMKFLWPLCALALVLAAVGLLAAAFGWIS